MCYARGKKEFLVVDSGLQFGSLVDTFLSSHEISEFISIVIILFRHVCQKSKSSMPPQKKGKSALKKGKSSGKTLDTQRSLYQTELENLRKHLGLNEKQVLAVIEEMTKIKVPGKDLSSDNTADDLKRKQDNGDGSNDNETNDTPPKRFRKAKDEIDAEYNLLIQPQLTLEVDNRLQTFNQVNVSNNQNRSLWHAIQLLWLGRERDTGRTLVLKYPVHARVQQLWDSVVHGPSNTPVYQARHKLYSAMLEENEELEGRIEDRRFGELL